MSFGALIVLAGCIAAIAVLTNNPVLVVGAMIVSPDYGPMAALSVALVNRAYGPAWRSFRALALGSPWLPWPRSCSSWPPEDSAGFPPMVNSRILPSRRSPTTCATCGLHSAQARVVRDDLE